MFIPGEEIWQKLHSERTGLWLVRPSNTKEIQCVIKFPTTILKAIYKGAPCHIIAGLTHVQGLRVRFLGLRVDDEPVYPFFTSHPSRIDSEHEAFEELLEVQNTKMLFFDERCRPLFSSICVIDLNQSKKVLDFIRTTKPHYCGIWNESIKLNHDVFDQVVGSLEYNFSSELLFYETIRIFIQSTQIFDILEPGSGRFKIDDLDEGAGFEQSIHASIKTVFSDNTFHSPIIKKGNTIRELTDFLAFDSKRICIIEAKALSVINSEITRSSDRKIKSIEKDIKKALRQLEGAARKLRSGTEIFDSNQNKIYVPGYEDSILHAIIVLSEINPFIERQKFAIELLKHTRIDEKIFFHILDFDELHQLVINTDTPSIFSTNLLIRLIEMLEKKDVLIRATRPPKGVTDDDILRGYGLL